MNARSSPGRKVHRLRDRLRAATADEILLSAEHCIAESGVREASMGEIAQRAGLAVGTLYNHFQDKDALLAALIKRRREALLAEIDERMRAVAKLPFRAQATSILRGLLEFFERHRPFIIIVRDDSAKDATLHAIHQRFEELIRRGIRAKALRAEVEPVGAAMLFGAARGMFGRFLWNEQEGGLSEHVETIVDVFMSGAGKKP